MSFAALESRALLTFVGPIALPTASALISSVPEPNPPGFAFDSSTTLNFDASPSGGGARNRTSYGTSPDSSGLGNSGDPDSPDNPPFDRLRNHVALSAMPVTVNGNTSMEIALADAGDSEVRVRIGDQTQILGALEGIDHPQSVELAYLANDGASDDANPYPDLIVVNSGGDNVLVFPGLAGGQFGPSLNGIQGYSVGENPVSVSVADVNNDDVPDLLVANQGSDSVTVLEGQQPSASTWSVNTSQTQTINVGASNSNTSPVKAIYVDVNKDGIGDLVVCNSGSNNLYIYDGTGRGSFDTSDPDIYSVGDNPIDMFVGQFDRRPQLDVVTVNAGSNDLTEIDGVFTSTSTTETISSGGILPDVAFAYQSNQNGMMGLVVGNSGDGRLTVLQPGNAGLQTAGIFSPSGLPIPTGLASGSLSVTGNSLELIAATAGQDAADLLRFNLEGGSNFLATPLSSSSGPATTDSELIAGLVPYGDSSLELIAIFWVGSPDDNAVSGEWSLREPSSITALYSPTEGQGSSPTSPTADVIEKDREPQANPDDSQQAEPPAVKLLMTGDSQKLNAAQQVIEALSPHDAIPLDPDTSSRQVVRLGDPTFDGIETDTQSNNGSIDDALRGLYQPSERAGQPESNAPVDPSKAIEPIPPLRREGLDKSASVGQAETVTLVSAVTLFSARLIVKATPPRPPVIRRGSGFRIRSGKPENPSGH